MIVCCYFLVFSPCCKRTGVICIVTASFAMTPCRHGLISTVFSILEGIDHYSPYCEAGCSRSFYRNFPPGERETKEYWWVALTPLVHPALLLLRNDISTLHSHSSTRECLPSCPLLPEPVRTTGQPISLPGGQERARNGFVSQASMLSPGPELQEWVLTSPIPRTEPAEKKKSKCVGWGEGGRKTLLEKGKK